MIVGTTELCFVNGFMNLTLRVNYEVFCHGVPLCQDYSIFGCDILKSRIN